MYILIQEKRTYYQDKGTLIIIILFEYAKTQRLEILATFQGARKSKILNTLFITNLLISKIREFVAMIYLKSSIESTNK